ncbi:HD-GYP domain-containing protein [Sulfuricurvum sp.]|uniref:HD-GYP domain-containing protein n=1 Tax=Sulfuricurvum sp. TaxID=2025608 RepID=UPI002616B374|nr:HD domain-containing phosphohydrolase [Sulfuricurvum sp.]MDD2265798.1 HD domain-containing protein [Sulfuricurvum sp.]MDD2783521.1 HD domain-containing protein [Sulfuricurvum sp.]HZF71564.1 HD domain-containing phosphohydrolase [Sulfuricurvum sp.]
MNKKRYKAIDKRLITEGSQISFNLFLTNETKSAMSLFLQSDTAVDGNAKVKLREIETLYVSEEDEERYNEYVAMHLQSIAKSSDIPTEQKARLVYQKATEAIDAMFKNPESLENVKNAQPVVNSFIDIILHDHSAVESLMKITAHDYYTHTHSINVSIYTLSLGSYLGIEGKDLEVLGMAAILHDLGKSKIDYEIINKNGKLTDDEFTQMKKHPALGHEIALKLGISDERILSGIRHHHEKMEGGGYPDNLKGDQISQFARIIGACDVFDALSTKRSYKDPMSSFESLLLMKQQMAGHLDMGMVDTFIKMLRKQGQGKS